MISESQRAAIAATVERQFQSRRLKDAVQAIPRALGLISIAAGPRPPRVARHPKVNGPKIIRAVRPTEKACVACGTAFAVSKLGRIPQRCGACLRQARISAAHSGPRPLTAPCEKCGQLYGLAPTGHTTRRCPECRQRKGPRGRRGCVECWHEGAPEAEVAQGGLCARHFAGVLEIERQARRPFPETCQRLRRFLPEVWPEMAATADLAREGPHPDVGPEEEALLLAWGTTFEEAEDPRLRNGAIQRLGPRPSDVLLGNSALGLRPGDAIFWRKPKRIGRIGSRASRSYS